MTITPVELRHVKLRRSLLGYGRRATDRLLADVVASYEDVWRERADLQDEVERLQEDVGRFCDLERLLRDTLMSAERSADELRAQAHREHEVLVQEARVKAREIVTEAETQRERLRAEVRRLERARTEMRVGYRMFLQAALERLEDDVEGQEAPGQAA